MFIFRIFKNHSTFRKNKRKIRIFVWLTVLMVFSAAGALGYILASNEPRVVEVTPMPSELPAGVEDSKIKKGATVEWEYEYRMCGHSIFLSCEADDSMVGLTFSQLQTENPDVRIVSFDTDKIVLKMSFDCYCPRHYILKQYKDGLAVFRTVLGTDEQEIYSQVPLKFEDIDTDKQEVLEAGKLFESADEMDHYIYDLDTKGSINTQ